MRAYRAGLLSIEALSAMLGMDTAEQAAVFADSLAPYDDVEKPADGHDTTQEPDP